MKIENISNSDFSIFVNSNYLDIKDFTDYDEIVEYVKKLVKRLKNKLCIKGFYKLKVFINDKVGLFIDIIKIDDLDYSNILDLKVIVFIDCDIYFETDDYFLVRDSKKVIFYNNKFYCSVSDLNGDIYKYCEFGNYIYGDDIFKVKELGIFI